MRTGTTLRRAALAATVLLTSLTACGDDGSPTEASTIAGAYAATTFLVTPDGQAERDVLAAGGSLAIAIGASNATTGTLSVPAAITGDSTFTANMLGAAERTGSSVKFDQTADSFVRDLNWTVNGETIRVTDQSVGGARYTIVLTR